MTTITTRDAPIDRTPTLTFNDSTEHHFYTFSELSLWYLYNRILGEDGSKHKALRVSLLKGFSTGLYRSTRTSTSKHPAFEDGCSSARKIVAVNTPTDKRSIISCAFWKGPCVYYPALEKKKNPKKRVSNVFSLTLDPLFQLLHTSRTTSLARTEGIAHNNTSSDHREGKDSISSTASFLLVSVVWTLSHNPNTRYPQRLQS